MTDPWARIARRTGWSATTVEWVVGAVLAVAAVALTTWMARDLWFTHDEWDYLADRSATSLSDLTRPIGGHTTFWSVLLLRGTYTLVGLDFWPWFFVPRLIGHTLLMVALWRIVLRRGADPLVAVLAYAALLVAGASGYQRAIQIGTWLVYGALFLCALVIQRRPDQPTRTDRIVVAVALLLAVLANGYAVAVMGGIALAVLLTRRLRVWLPSLAPAALLYLVLFVAYRDDARPRSGYRLGSLLDIPWASFRVLRRAVESATAAPTWLAALLVVGLLAWMVALAVRRRFDLFDAIVLLALAAGLAALTIQRVSFDPDAADRLRYGYLVTVLLAVVLVPKIPRPRGAAVTVAVTVAGLWVVGANVDQLRTAFNVREAAGQETRVLSVAAAGMIAAGEPVAPGPSELASGLEIDELTRFIADGYDPEPLPADHPDRAAIETAARGALRMNVVGPSWRSEDHEPPAGEPVRTTASVDGQGCVEVRAGEPVTAEVTAAGLLRFDKGRRQALTLTWADRHGTGVRRIDDPDLRAVRVQLAEPDGTAELTLQTSGPPLTVCGFAPG